MLSRPRGLLVVVLSLLVTVAPIVAQPTPRDEWIVARTDHFTVYSDAREKKAREILMAMEELRVVLSAFAKPHVGAEPRTIVFAFGSNRSLEPYLAAPPERNITRMVEYRIDSDATYVVLNASGNTEAVLPWAYQAYLLEDLRRRYPELPHWAQTGLAHFYSRTQVDRSGKVRIGMPHKEHLDRLRSYTWIPLDRLFRVDRSSDILRQPHSLGLYQAECWVLAHYALTGGGSGNLEAGGAFYGALAGGLSPEEAIRQVFGQSLQDFAHALSTYMRSFTLNYLSFEPDGLPLDDADYPFEPADHDEILLALGQHLVRGLTPPPVELAERHLMPLTEKPQTAGDAWAALAELRQESGRLDDARRLFETALAAEPRQATSYLAYARLLETSSGTSGRQREALEKAVQLDPAFGEAWARLGRSYYGVDSGRQIECLRQALELMPERSDVAYNLAMALLAEGDPAAARAVIEARLRNPDDRELAQRADREVRRLELVDATNDAVDEGDLEAALERYRQAVAEATDPAGRAQMESDLRRLEEQAERNRRTERFNAIVERLNRGETAGAEDALRELLEEVEDDGLRGAIEGILERLPGS